MQKIVGELFHIRMIIKAAIKIVEFTKQKLTLLYYILYFIFLSEKDIFGEFALRHATSNRFPR